MNRINSINTNQKNSFRNWLPNKKTVVAMATFTALATTTIGLTYLCCKPACLSEHNYDPFNVEDFAFTGFGVAASKASDVYNNASLLVFNGLGLIAAAAHVFNNTQNQQHMTESIKMQPAITHPILKNLLDSTEFDQLLGNSSPSLSGIAIEEIDNCEATLAQALPEVFTCSRSSLLRQNRTEFELPKNRGLASNLKLAQEILEETQKAVLFSPNNLARSHKLLHKQALSQGLELKNVSSIRRAGTQCLEKLEKIVNVDTYTFFEKARIKAELSEKTKIGFCGHMAAVAFFKALKKGVWNVELDVVNIVGGDHAFLVIGRRPGSNPIDYTTWGSSALVIDPWAERDNIFLVSEIAMYLNDYLGDEEETGKPFLVPFDPNRQRLEISLVNIYSHQSLLNYANRISMNAQQTQSVQNVLKKLKHFHQTEHFQTKWDAAKALVALCANDSIVSIPGIRILREQVEYFIELSHSWTY